jgi:5-methylcytosine-specific restriction endonuclease McrA
MQKSKARSTSAEKYRRLYSQKAWATLRKQILLRDLYTCQSCKVPLTTGRSDPRSAVVNHIKPHKGALYLFYNPNNLQAVCKECHDGRIQAMERGGTSPIGLDGWPVDE